MEHRILGLLLFLIFVSQQKVYGQESTSISLKEAVQLALKNSNQAKIAETKVVTAENELKSTKNLQWPNLNISGQYQRLNSPSVKSELGGDSGSGGTPKVKELYLGRANLSIPIFNGFKFKNAIKSSENQYQAAIYTADNDKEELSLQVIQQYITLFKLKQSINLLEENLKSNQQRVKDFTNMEKNGLLARNDLLKAELQESNVMLSLEEARKNERMANYRLQTTLKLPANTQIEIADEQFDSFIQLPLEDSIYRNDFKALTFQLEAAENQVKVAKGGYYPSLSVVGGYINLSIPNVLTVTNAMNIGLGVSYNIADIFKTRSKVEAAKSRALELALNVNRASDQINVQVEEAKQNYQLAIKQFEVYNKSAEQAEENYRIVKDKYDNGLEDTNDLLEADLEQLRADINLANAKANISEKYYALMASKGVLNQSINN